MHQLILSNQLHPDYIHPDTTDCRFVIAAGRPSTPVGTLQFHLHSRIFEYASVHHVADDRRELGYRTHILYTQTYRAGIDQIWEHTDELLVMQPAEPYMEQMIRSYSHEYFSRSQLLLIIPNGQFLLDHETYLSRFPTKPPIMEQRYRRIRRHLNILMDGDKPVGGKRNFDHENRGFKSDHQPVQRPAPQHTAYVQQAIQHLGEHGAYGESVQDFDQPVSRQQALQVLERFVRYGLSDFGELEDAMYESDRLVYHSNLGTAINAGLLTPREVIDAVLEHADTIPLNSLEGFVRQIIGRREYMRHRYQVYHPRISESNVLAHDRDVPERFWTGKTSDHTDLHCLSTVIQRVKQHGYSHHIERLMIVGNISMLLGLDPRQLTKWFREMYTDARERVVIPNVMGMSQYADGGNLATKPYISGAGYIDKMSDFCGHCTYNPKQKTGPTACPLTTLYRGFIQRHRELYKGGRQPFMLKHLDNMDQPKLRQDTQDIIEDILTSSRTE